MKFESQSKSYKQDKGLKILCHVNKARVKVGSSKKYFSSDLSIFSFISQASEFLSISH